MIREKWKTVPIKSVYHGLYDGPHATPAPCADGPVFLGIKNVTDDGALDLTDIRHISESEFPRWTKRVNPRPGDIVFTYEATLNRYAIVPEGFRGCLGRRMALIRTNPEKIDTRFLHFYFFSKQWREVISSNIPTGATVDRIPLTKFPDFPITIPDLPTQRKIAGILSAYDDLIENNLRRIKMLEEMAQSLYREWFVHFRFPGHEAAKFVDTELGQIPQGWEIKKLGELADQMRRGVSKGELDSTVRYVGLEHIPRQSLALDSWEETTELGSNKLAFERGEVLFGKIRPYFHKVSVAPFDGICSADTIVIRSKKPEHRALVTACVFTEAFVAHATATSNGSKMPRTDWKVLKDYPHVLPSKELLDRFSALFFNAIKQQQNLVSHNQNLSCTRDLLLPKILSGSTSNNFKFQ